MKSLCNLIVLGSTLGALAAGLAGCGDDDSTGGASCAQVCAKVTAAKCDNDPDCMDTCTDVKDSTPMGCTDDYNTLADCYAGAKFTCDADKQSVAKECSKQEQAYAKCLQTGGKDNDKDAGEGGSNAGKGGTNAGGTNGGGGDGNPATLEDGGMGGSGASGNGGTGGDGTNGGACSGTVDGACPQCIQASCCDEVVACQNDFDCPALEECVANCGDQDCVQTCADSTTATAVDLYNAILDCAANQCESECTGDGTSQPDAGMSAGGPDVGEPNDGNGGHPSADPPPDCLFISPDVTGYCEEVQYKVIYDCPNGAPYDDCEENKIGSSGIWCCGH